MIVPRRQGEIASFDCCGTGQNDIGMFCARIPAPVIHNNGVRFCPGSFQLPQILMMMERITAGPPDQPDIRVDIFLSVILKLLSRIEQHIGNARHGDEGPDRICPLRKSGMRQRTEAVADRINGTVSETDTTARQTDLPQHRRQSNHRLKRIFTILLAGQRPTDGDHRSHTGHIAGQVPDVFGRNTA